MSATVGVAEDVDCSVKDSTGSALPGEAVSFTTAGVGGLVSEAHTISDASGSVTVQTLSSQPGSQIVTATLNVDEEGAEPDEVDDCDRQAGDPTGALAGACSDTVSISWSGSLPECSDGLDNDGDGNIDHPTDGGCSSESDESEGQPKGATCSGQGTILGTPGSDVLTGTPGSDTICGRGGSDVLLGRGGDDLLLGGRGGDELRGGRGRDILKGGRGTDLLLGGRGDDSLDGGPGIDRCDAGDRRRSLSCERRYRGAG